MLVNKNLIVSIAVTQEISKFQLSVDMISSDNIRVSSDNEIISVNLPNQNNPNSAIIFKKENKTYYLGIIKIVDINNKEHLKYFTNNDEMSEFLNKFDNFVEV